MIRNLFSIVNKNFRILARSKLSLISIILVPVLVILLTGFAFNSSGLNQVNVGIYSESYSDLTNEIVSEFEMQNYTINRLNSTEQCSEDVKQGFSQICIVFPKDLSDKGDSEEILFYVDHSRINLAYILINEVILRYLQNLLMWVFLLHKI